MRVPGSKPRGDVNLWGQVAGVLQDKVQNYPIFGDLIEVFTGREDDDPNDIGSMLLKLKTFVGGLFGFRTSIASRVSAIEGKIATGAEFYDDFNRGENTGGLGNGWTQGGEGQPLGIRDQAAMIIQGGITAQQGRRWAKSPTPASGNTFTVSMVTHPADPSRYAETWLFARMNSAFTEGLIARMVLGKCWIARVSRTSSTSNAWTVTNITPTPATTSYTKSATVEFKGEETVLQLIIDSKIVLSESDSVHAIDAAHRENGFAEQTTTQALGFSPEYSGALASYSLKSVAVLQSVSTTAQVVATATVAPVASAVTAGSTGAAQPADADPGVYAATKAVADAAASASAAATTANTKATAAQSAVQSLVTGGTRTIYTSDFTYVPPPNLVRLGIIVIGSGGGGPGAQLASSTRFAFGGGYRYLELPASAIPASVNGTVGAARTGTGSDTVNQSNVSSFGSLLSSPLTGLGSGVSGAGFSNLNNSAPGNGGLVRSAGGTSELAIGGTGGTGAGISGTAGANASTTGTALAGGGGGGGGYGRTNTEFQNGGNGGAGGFPGGGGGAGGNGLASGTGGTGAPGLIALIEYLS